jgi:hypothetical protein
MWRLEIKCHILGGLIYILLKSMEDKVVDIVQVECPFELNILHAF